MPDRPTACSCPDPDTLGTGATTCLFFETGYPWCRACREHHRAPECPVDEHGRALSSCGCPWQQIASYEAGNPHTCSIYAAE